MNMMVNITWFRFIVRIEYTLPRLLFADYREKRITSYLVHYQPTYQILCKSMLNFEVSDTCHTHCQAHFWLIHMKG